MNELTMFGNCKCLVCTAEAPVHINIRGQEGYYCRRHALERLLPDPEACAAAFSNVTRMVCLALEMESCAGRARSALAGLADAAFEENVA